ncbi:MAG: S41 family peptidase [Gemmatimonadaceae bacterium]
MTRVRKLVLAASLALPIAVGGWVAQERSSRDGAKLFDQVLSLVSDRYVDTVNAGALYEKAARGLVQQLNDPYSEFYTPKENAQFTIQSSGKYGGLGMLIEPQGGTDASHPDHIVIVTVYPNTPAEAAHIFEGDQIVGIDTMSTKGWTSTKVSEVLKGIVGTKVTVRFARPGVAQPIEHRFTRAEIHIPAVPFSTMLENKTAYIPLQQFNETAIEELQTQLDRLVKEGAKSLILDLRNNPGGILEEGLAVPDLFLRENQQIASVRGRGDMNQTFMSRSAGRHVSDLPLVVLVDDRSASASEIAAGALQDHDRALIVGTTSFGKGLVQSVYNLDGGYALKLTTAKWYTPSGRSIQRERKNGVLVDSVKPDSIDKESAKKNKPVYKSDAGRVIYGGGGITPDVIVNPDTLTTPEQDFFKAAIGPKLPTFRTTLYQYALELKPTTQPNFTMKAEWRDEIFRRLVAVKVTTDRAAFDKAQPTIDRFFTDYLSELAFGKAAAFQRRIPEDAQLKKALELLNKGHTQKELLSLASALTK